MTARAESLPRAGVAAAGAAPVGPVARSRGRRLLATVGPAALIVALLLVGWQLAVVLTDARPQILPSPLRVVQQVMKLARQLTQLKRASSVKKPTL